MNIALIGMSGAGKSYLGKQLAERLGFDYIDLDEEMERMYAKPLPQIIADIGDEEFISAEAGAAISRTQDADRLVVSTGGSIVYAPEAMDHLRRISRVVYLKVDLQTLKARIEPDLDRTSRIVRLRGKTLEELIAERTPLYEQFAHETIDQEGLSVEQVLERMASFARGSE